MLRIDLGKSMQHQEQLPSDQNTTKKIAVTKNIKVRPAVLKKQSLKNSKKTVNRIKLGLPDSVQKENEESPTSMVGSQNNRRLLKD